MRLYKLTQTENDGNDTYDSCVVCAADEDAARRMHPSELTWVAGAWRNERGPVIHHDDDGHGTNYGPWAKWAPPDRIRVELIGTAAEGMEPGVVVASYTAGSEA